MCKSQLAKGTIVFLLVILTWYPSEISPEEVKCCNNHQTEFAVHVGHFTDENTLQIVHGGAGVLYCVNALTGKEIWRQNYGESLPCRYGSVNPNWFWYPVELPSLDSHLQNILIWHEIENRTPEDWSIGKMQWDILKGSTGELLATIPVPSNETFDYVSMRDIDGDGAKEMIFSGWNLAVKAIYDPDENQTSLLHASFLETLFEENIEAFNASYHVTDSSFIDVNGDGQKECIVQCVAGRLFELLEVAVGIFDWKNNWTLVRSSFFRIGGDFYPTAEEHVYYGNFSKGPNYDAALVYGGRGSEIVLELHDGISGEIYWDYSLPGTESAIEYGYRFQDLTGDGVPEWIVWWRNDTWYNPKWQNFDFLAVLDIAQEKSWQIPFKMAGFTLHAHGKFPLGYFANCFEDFTKDSIADLVLPYFYDPDVKAICVIDGSNGTILHQFQGYDTPQIEIVDISQDGIPEIVLCEPRYHRTRDPETSSSKKHCNHRVTVIDGATGDVKWQFQSEIGVESSIHSGSSSGLNFSPSWVLLSTLLGMLIAVRMNSR